MSFKPSISFHAEDTSFSLENENDVIKWIRNTIVKEGKKSGEITYIFCSDNYLHKINLDFLNHDTLTDIITFNYCEDDVINADIFISIDRVRENANDYEVSFITELNRVMIHGVLHLLGYNDKTEAEQSQMRAKEDFYLSLQSK